jgi:uncharacterized iron-regulated membrane protein
MAGQFMEVLLLASSNDLPEKSMKPMDQPPVRKSWPDYRAVWRWHFYAGLFSIPFIIVLSISGAIYLFKPQIESWLDLPYDHLMITNHPASSEAQVKAALTALPGATLSAYELPKRSEAAIRVIVNQNGEKIRVYLHPETLAILKTIPEKDRLMNVIFRLHGELLLGNTGSAIVELAASWAIIMIVTGLYLWWPRQTRDCAGIVYPRLSGGGRVFWRDLHAVAGIWISFFALFLLLTGLPWAKVWGEYFKQVRRITGTAATQQDWSTGSVSNRANGTISGSSAGSEAMTGEHADHMAKPDRRLVEMNREQDYTAIDKIIATVQPLELAWPVLISPPSKGRLNWTAKSDAQNRPLRVNLVLDGSTGNILKRENFKDRHPIDQIVGTFIAAHEGQLFGWINQLLGLLTASGLIFLAISALIMWWRRRPARLLGAPEPLQNPRFSFGLGVFIVIFGMYLPLFGASLIVVQLVEHLIFKRIPVVRDWLGLTPA